MRALEECVSRITPGPVVFGLPVQSVSHTIRVIHCKYFSADPRERASAISTSSPDRASILIRFDLLGGRLRGRDDSEQER